MVGVSGSIEVYDGPRPGRRPYNFMDSYPVAVDRQNQQLGLSREHVRTSAACGRSHGAMYDLDWLLSGRNGFVPLLEAGLIIPSIITSRLFFTAAVPREVRVYSCSPRPRRVWTH